MTRTGGPATAVDAAARWPTAVGALVAATLAFVAFVTAPVSQAGGDSLWVAHTSASILSDGDLDLTEYVPLMEEHAGASFHLLGHDGQLVDYFPWGAAVVVAPFLAVTALVGEATGRDVPHELETTLPAADLERQVASLVGAATVGLMVVLLRLRLRSLPWALALAAAFASCTGVMSTTTRNLWIQGPGMLVVVLVLLVAQLLDQRRGAVVRRDLALAAAAGALVTLAYATRPPLALLGPVALVLCWRRSPTVAGACGAAMAAGFAAFAAINVWAYGEWRPLYYRSRLTLDSTAIEAFAANLASPARGLFVWSPLLLGGVLWCLARWRDAPLLDRLIVLWAVGHLCAMALFEHWWAGASVGPRLMLDVVPGLVLLLTPLVAALAATSHAWRRHAVAALVVATAWSGVVHVRAAHRISVMEWNFPTDEHRGVDEAPERVWDWRDPQFLA